MLKFRRLMMLGVAALAIAVAQPAAAADLYTLTKTTPLGGGVKWDYLHFDAASGRVFVSHGTELTVVDAKTGAIVGHVAGLSGSHGMAIDPDTGLGYADSALTKNTIVFDLKTLKTVKTIPALLDADGMAYDPVSAQVFNVGGDANAVLVVDAKTNKPVTTIPLGGSPEFLVSDGAGSVYVNINDKNEIVRINTKTNAITARWPVAPCVGPVGLSVDTATRRLFASCDNALMVAVDADSGKIVAQLPIGKGTDADAFDPAKKLVFSSNRDGTLTVISETGPDNYTVLGNVKTALGARTLAVDPSTGRVFLVTAAVQSVTPPQTADDHPHFVFKPGSLKLMMYDPAN